MDNKELGRKHGEARELGAGPFADNLEHDFIERYQVHDLLSSKDPEHEVERRINGEVVVVKKRMKHNPFSVASAFREIAALNAMSDPSIPSLREWIESGDSVWTVLDEKPNRSIRDYISLNGAAAEPTIKTTATQLFAALACIFAAGFSHLRICDETVFIDQQEHVMLTNFEYVHEYGKEKVDGMYALVSDKHGDDIYVAPEVFASVRYNARKAAIWSCGVLIYFMTTGQTDKLSTLGHPSFEGHADHAVSSSRRKLSSASQQAFHSPLIAYPHNRLNVPMWIRDVISKMLAPDPARRAELIEVAAKVPKEVHLKATRPLMELAWLDYKQHVGPLAGLATTKEDGASSFSFSAFSSWSRDSLGSLLPGRGRDKRRATVVTETDLSGEGSSRRKSMWK